MLRGSLVYLVPIIVLVMMVLGIYLVRNGSRSRSVSSSLNAVSSPIDTIAPSSTQTAEPTPSVLKKSSQASGTPRDQGVSDEISSWKYPNSTISSQSSSDLSMQSGDDTTTITNWYKTKIQNLGMNVKTFVTTNNNGNVLNKLSGSSNNLSVSVEISKDAENSLTVISVKL